MDEWNYWHRDYVYGELGCVYDLADGLGVAAGLHEFFRQSDLIHMAHYAQTVNVIGAIKTTRTAAEMETTGLVLQLYRAHYGQIPLRLEQDFAPVRCCRRAHQRRQDPHHRRDEPDGFRNGIQPLAFRRDPGRHRPRAGTSPARIKLRTTRRANRAWWTFSERMDCRLRLPCACRP